MTTAEQVLQTRFHRFVFTEAGALSYPASCEADLASFSRGEADEYTFAEVLALADYIQAHRDEIVQAQVQLEQTWRAVADELIDCFEAQEPGSSTECTGESIQHQLDALGPVAGPMAPTAAGRWYQTLWEAEESPLFLQQWVPFLTLFAQRCQERFPERLVDAENRFEAPEPEAMMPLNRTEGATALPVAPTPPVFSYERVQAITKRLKEIEKELQAKPPVQDS